MIIGMRGKSCDRMASRIIKSLSMLLFMIPLWGKAQTIALPPPNLNGSLTLEQTLHSRRSVREYRNEPLTLAELSQLLWAAQGVTHPEGLRTAPSAGALYPLEVYAVVGAVNDLPADIYKYLPREHTLQKITEGDKRAELAQAALGQSCVGDAPLVIAITAVYQRTMKKYGERGVQYAQVEAGAAAQNVYLQATALNLGTVFVGAFHDDEVAKVLQLSSNEKPVALLPVGKPK